MTANEKSILYSLAEDRPSLELTNAKDTIKYLAFCISTKERTDEPTESWIVGLLGNDYVEEWGEKEPRINMIIEWASDLEVKNGSESMLKEFWHSIIEKTYELARDYKLLPR